jgi:hypothetical protein
MNPKGPSRMVALVTEIMELLFRDYRAFDQRLWSFCSEIVELFLRDLLQLHVDFLI